MTRADWMTVEREFNRRDRLQEADLSYGRWTRWGRGSCEGYGLEIGMLLRFSVAASPDRTVWRASLNGTDLGSHDSFEAAIARCEREARFAMRDALEHWEIFLAQPPARRRSGRNRK
ncbi:MAG: hypothetical protein B7X53_00030 [Hyphomonas sp. 34-62-18]|nr:hypothetical protein [Hyphomonas sp. 34-62-18]OZB19390.1 MAG: hypothetical protein B7X53_00030 [Hyphomonas sp. 34-62-18]